MTAIRVEMESDRYSQQGQEQPGSRLRQIERREWFVEGGSRKRVKDRAHFDYLVTTYLPRHRGWKWSSEKGKRR